MRKRFLGLLMACCMIFSLAMPVSYAAGGSLVVGTGSVEEGDTDTVVPITITKTGDAGLIGMNFKVQFPDELELTAKPVLPESPLFADQGTHSTVFTSPYIIAVGDDLALENVTAEGLVLTLNFKVKEGTAPGDYAITLVDMENLDADLAPVELAVTNGKITVTEKAVVEKVKVTFDADNGTTAEVKEIDKDTAVEAPAEPSKDGFTFDGWYNGTDKWDFSNTVSADMTLKAQWTEIVVVPDKVKVTFDADNGSTAETKEIVKDTAVAEPAAPTKEGYDFDGWYNGTAKWNFSEKVSADMTLTAHWKEKAGSSETSDPTPITPDGKKGCYVATSVYGSYDCPEVWTLRRYRDEVLGETWYGRMFIKAYYTVSPTLVKWFGDSDWFQSFFRARLDQMVDGLQAEGFASTPYEDINW